MINKVSLKHNIFQIINIFKNQLIFKSFPGLSIYIPENLI